VRRLAAGMVVATVTLSAACTGGGGHPAGRSSTSTSPAESASPSPVLPLKQVAPQIEAFVEKERGLTFKHSVHFAVLGKKAFLAKLHAHDKPPKPLEVEKSQAVFTSLGLISRQVDLVKAFRTATDEGTLGFYDPKSKRMYVLGHRATPGVRAVLSHELTHALTDQWFGINRPKLDKGNQELGLAFSALTEGDAERTRLAYEKTMSAADQATAKREEGGDSAAPKVPKVVLELIGFPYAIGPSFVNAVVAHGGIKALNAAYRRPPKSSEQLVDPPLYFAHHDPVHVATPHPDRAKLDHGDLGFIGLALMLEHGIGGAAMQGALAGWAGDQYVAWRVGAGHWCLRDTVVLTDSGAAAQFDNALSQCVAARNGKAHLEQQGVSTTFKACSG
jgi:hypothetical protein